MTQSFAKKNSFTAVQLNNMCRMYQGIETIVGGTGDKTINLPFDWTNGYVQVIMSESSSVWSNTTNDRNLIHEASYDSLTGSYTSGQNIVHAKTTTAGSVHQSIDKTTNLRGVIKSATPTSFTLDDDGTTLYVKYFVWAPYTATIQMDGSNIILSGSGAPATTPQFIGQSYLNTTAKREYRAYGTSSSADWILTSSMPIGQVCMVNPTNSGANEIGAARYVARETCYINRIAVPCQNPTDGMKMIFGIYSEVAGYPTSLLGYTNEYTVVSTDLNGEIILDLVSPVLITAKTAYWLAYSNNTAFNVYCSDTTTSANHGYYKARTYDSTMPTTYPTSANNKQFVSIYALR